MKTGESVLHPVLGRGTVVNDNGQGDLVVVDFTRPFKGWDNPIKVKKSILKEVEPDSQNLIA